MVFLALSNAEEFPPDISHLTEPTINITKAAKPINVIITVNKFAIKHSSPWIVATSSDAPLTHTPDHSTV